MIVKDFQRANGLQADGLIGRLTFSAFCMVYDLTPIQAAHFLAQCHHESGGFALLSENLNYSAERLLAVWPNRYDTALALKHEHKPSVIANHAYGGRMGNTEPNDGWRFRGRGPLQLTGRSNYEALAESLNLPAIVDTPDLVATKYAFSSAIWFFRVNKIFDLCRDLEPETVLKVSRAINLGNPNSTKKPNGLADRQKQTIFYSKFIT
jgi:putative chitinase